MKQSRAKKILCLLSAAALILTSGCTGQGVKYGEKQKVENREQQADPGECQSTAMGRYREQETDLEKLEEVSGMKQMPGGKLVITDCYTGIWESADQGATWKQASHVWLDAKMKQAYFLDVQIAPDGTLAVIYNDYYEKETGEEPEEGEKETEIEEAEDEEQESSVFDNFHPVCKLVKPDGTVVPVEFSLTEDEMYPFSVWISEEGKIFVTTLGDNVYEVKEDGSSKMLFTTEGRPQLVQFWGNRVIVDGYDFKAPFLYDLDKGEEVEDPVFAEFVEENYGDRGFNGGSWYDLYLFPGPEGELYLAGEKGLHRYVSGEEEVEQLIEGNLSRLGSPLYGLKNMLLLENGEFLSVSGRGKLVNFAYDPNMPAVPAESLKVYSLEENWNIQTAISLFQISHPDVRVEYEIGMGEGDAVTREDALKKLNTRILAGEGPDVLVMDGLPMDSYMEKGLLLDLSDFMTEVDRQEPLHKNLYQALAEEGKIYTVPLEVDLPVLIGRQRYVSQMKDLPSMAEEICRIREDNPGKDLISICEAKAMMKAFVPIVAPGWKSRDGEIDLEAVEGFLTQIRRIYDAQMDGLSEKSLEEHRETDEYYAEAFGEDWMYDITWYGEESLYYVADSLQLSVGVTTSPSGYYDMTSISRNVGFEDTLIKPMEGNCGKVFVPETMLSINAASGKMDLAKEFLKCSLGKEIQTALGGYVLNQKALEEIFKPNEEYVGENGEYGMMGITYDDGRQFFLEVFVPGEEEMKVFGDWIESVDTPYLADMVLEKTVFEEGEKFVLGEQDMEETLTKIEQQLAIYLSE